jgi:hypothetical protein
LKHATLARAGVGGLFLGEEEGDEEDVHAVPLSRIFEQTTNALKAALAERAEITEETI